MWNSLWLWCFEALLESEKSTITTMNSTSRCSSRCPSGCAIHYGYRAWTFPCCKSGKKKEPKPKRFGPDIFGWGGGLPREGVGAKVPYVLRNPGQPNFLAGYLRILPGYPGSARKVWEKKFVFNFRSLINPMWAPGSLWGICLFLFLPQNHGRIHKKGGVDNQFAGDVWISPFCGMMRSGHSRGKCLIWSTHLI